MHPLLDGLPEQRFQGVVGTIRRGHRQPPTHAPVDDAAAPAPAPAARTREAERGVDRPRSARRRADDARCRGRGSRAECCLKWWSCFLLGQYPSGAYQETLSDRFRGGKLSSKRAESDEGHFQRITLSRRGLTRNRL